MIFFLVINSSTSSEDKVEKVVRPPKIPMITKGSIQSNLSDEPNKKPMIKLPTMLTKGVATGNILLNLRLQKLVIKPRMTAPMPPPNMINKQLIMRYVPPI